MKMNDFVTRTSMDEIRGGAFSSAQGGRFGATSSVSFEKRQEIDRRKTKIRSYQDSALARSQFYRRSEVLSSANSSIQSIENRRSEKQKVSNSQISKFDNSRKRANNLRTGSMLNISQSGRVGARNFVSQTHSSSRFYSIKPNINH